MAVRVAVHHPSPDSTWDNWLDSTPDLSSVNSTQAYCVDIESQPTDLAVGGSNPSRRAEAAAQRQYSKGSSKRPPGRSSTASDAGRIGAAKSRRARGDHAW